MPVLTRYRIGEDGTPYLLTPNMPPHAIGVPGTAAQAETTIAAHRTRWNAGQRDGPDRTIDRVRDGDTYLYRRRMAGVVTYHANLKDAQS